MHQGDNLAQFEIIGLIGAGGMGEVYRARDTVLDRQVALKILPAAWCEDPERLARIRREARVLASLNHPNIATIHSLEDSSDRTFLVMELVEGKDLAEILRDGPLPLDRALEIAVQIATGLEEAHGKGFIHRDLKPANIKVTAEGKVKILDFGLARALVDDTATPGNLENSPTITAGMTAAGVILGTAAYMSPEQARGKEVDERTDIWAFGCILLEMLTGRSFFAGETYSDTLATILKTDPSWDDLPKGLPRGIRRLLRRCLAKNPADRLHAIADVRIELLDMSHEPGGAASAAPSGPRGGRAGWIVAAVLGVAVVVLAARAWRPEPRPHLPARLDTMTFTGREWSPDASRDGDLIVYSSDQDGIARIWMKEVAGGGEVPLTEGPDDMARFSPDGSQILFIRDVQGSRQLYRKTIVGNQLRKVLDDAVEGDWSPDGQQVCFLRAEPEEGDNTVLVGTADLKSGRETILARIEKLACYGLRWSPDGAHISVNTTSLTGNLAETSGIVVIDVASGSVSNVFPTDSKGPYSCLEWSPDGDSFIVGQSPEVIAHVTGTPSLVMEYDLDTRAATPLFWLPLRLPKGSWGATSMAVLEGGDIVLDQQISYTEQLIYPVTGDGMGQPRVLTSALSIDRQPVFSPDGRRLMFSSNRGGNVDIWIMDLATGQLSRLTDDPAGDWDPAFTPDGQSMLWSSDRSGNMEIWMAAIDGSGARQVTHDGIDAENPTMTRDAQWIIYASSGNERRGVWKIRPDGTDDTQLASGAYLIPEVSPDGTKALFMVISKLDSYVKIIDLETREILGSLELEITERDENVVFGRARWTPDGKGIVYIGQDEDGNSGVFMTNFTPGAAWDGSRRKVAGFDHLFTTETLGMSPDGKHVVIGALNERRTLMRASDVDLARW